MKFKDFASFQLVESQNSKSTNWINGSREWYLENPKPPFHWKSIEKVTPATKELLKKFEKYVSDVAIFCWHPDIKSSQFWDSQVGYDEGKSNYNSRIMTAGNISIKLKPGKKNEIQYFDLIRKSIQHEGLEALGGNGSGDEASMQISDFQDKNLDKLKIYTPGAYKQEMGKWKYIPLDDLDTTPLFMQKNERQEKILKELGEVFASDRQIFDIGFWILKTDGLTGYRLKVNPVNMITTLNIVENGAVVGQNKLDNKTLNRLQILRSKIRSEDIDEFMRNLVENFGTYFPGVKVENNDNAESLIKKIHHEHRAKIASKRFNF